MDIGKLAQYGALGSMILPSLMGGKKDKSDDSGDKGDPKSYSRGDQASDPSGGSDGGTSSEFNYYPHAKYYAKGGLASLDGDKNGHANDQELIDKTIQAITTQDPNGQATVHKFLKEFGPQALQDLVSKIQAKTQGGQQAPIDPNSHGMSDSVPAQIQGAAGQTAPAQISEGEYVVPSDVVAHLGNGSTGAGAKQLEGMVARTRAARGSPSAGPTQIDPQAMMPQ
jgi:hypothetical protein